MTQERKNKIVAAYAQWVFSMNDPISEIEWLASKLPDETLEEFEELLIE